MILTAPAPAPGHPRRDATPRRSRRARRPRVVPRRALGARASTPAVVALDAYPAVEAAYDAWDANPCSVTTANAVVRPDHQRPRRHPDRQPGPRLRHRHRRRRHRPDGPRRRTSPGSATRPSTPRSFGDDQQPDRRPRRPAGTRSPTTPWRPVPGRHRQRRRTCSCRGSRSAGCRDPGRDRGAARRRSARTAACSTPARRSSRATTSSPTAPHAVADRLASAAAPSTTR